MPFVDIKVIEGVFTHDEKRQAVQNVAETLLDTWGEGMRDSMHVVITETPSGEWAVGGRPLTSDDVKEEMRGGS